MRQGLAAGDDDEVDRVEERDRRLSALNSAIEALADAERSFITALYEEESTLGIRPASRVVDATSRT
jgi:hypothetical protein